jgi:hypothetical protein
LVTVVKERRRRRRSRKFEGLSEIRRPPSTSLTRNSSAFSLAMALQCARAKETDDGRHAPGADKAATPSYELFETVVLSKEVRRHHRRW